MCTNDALLEEAFVLLPSDYLFDLPERPQPGGIEEYRRSASDLYTAFPDLRHTIEDQIAEGDRVVVRLTARGTHRGPLGTLPATGRRMAVAETAIFLLDGNRIAEQWPQVDALGMLQQLGAIPRG